MRRTLLFTALACTLACADAGRPTRLRLGTTTSVRDSGLLDALLPAFRDASRGTPVDVIAVGTGAAFTLARDGNVDLLVVHDPQGEEEFLAAGHGRLRRPFMWNSFELLGPPDDPAGVRTAGSGAVALARIAEAGAPFVSRGDDSGTHRCERRLWAAAGGRRHWRGYRETGQGMGATLRIAEELGAYVLVDRGTRLGYRGALRLVPLLAETPELRNEYSVVSLNPARHPQANHAGARTLADWLVSAEAGRFVAAFQVGGQQLFHPIGAAP